MRGFDTPEVFRIFLIDWKLTGSPYLAVIAYSNGPASLRDSVVTNLALEEAA